MNETVQLLLLLLPLILVDFGMRIYAVLDILKDERRVKGDKKLLWMLFCGLINYGWVVYFIIGRED